MSSSSCGVVLYDAKVTRKYEFVRVCLGVVTSVVTYHDQIFSQSPGYLGRDIQC